MNAIKPILKYPGAKWNLAEWIISHFPSHQHYIEPFFGSGAVFFNKQPARHEVINDLSGDVVNLFRVIRERGEELAALIEMTPWAREENRMAHQETNDPVERARRLVVRSWQTHGSGGPRGSTWSHGATSLRFVERPAMWRQVPPRILALVERLRDAEIECCDAVQMIPDYADPDALFYVDPPYPFETRNGKLYMHEMTDADHAALLDALDLHPGPVVLSGYHCALYDDRLRHWTTREKQAQAEKGNMRTEVLWLNPTCVDRLGYGPLFD